MWKCVCVGGTMYPTSQHYGVQGTAAVYQVLYLSSYHQTKQTKTHLYLEGPGVAVTNSNVPHRVRAAGPGIACCHLRILYLLRLYTFLTNASVYGFFEFGVFGLLRQATQYA